MVKRLNSGQRRWVSRQIASSASLKTWVWFQRPTERWTKGKNQPSKLSSDLHMRFMVHAGTQHMHSHAHTHTNNRWFILNSKKKNRLNSLLAQRSKVSEVLNLSQTTRDKDMEVQMVWLTGYQQAAFPFSPSRCEAASGKSADTDRRMNRERV